MSSENENSHDLDALVADSMSGKSGYANTKKLKSLGIEEYKKWLQGKFTVEMIKSNDPRRQKRAARKARKSAS
jgi:hypothetical protein